MRSGSETMIPPTRNFVTSIHNFAQTWHFYWEIHCIFTFLLDAFCGVECWIENLTRSDWCLSSSPHVFQHTRVIVGTKNNSFLKCSSWSAAQNIFVTIENFIFHFKSTILLLCTAFRGLNAPKIPQCLHLAPPSIITLLAKEMTHKLIKI